jgi:hypothetical protein
MFSVDIILYRWARDIAGVTKVIRVLMGSKMFIGRLCRAEVTSHSLVHTY